MTLWAAHPCMHHKWSEQPPNPNPYPQPHPTRLQTVHHFALIHFQNLREKSLPVPKHICEELPWMCAQTVYTSQLIQVLADVEIFNYLRYCISIW